MKLFLIALLAFSFNANAIDSLLKEAAKHEKERVKKAGKGKAAAILTFSSGEVVECAWLARAGDNWRYERKSDGKLVTTPIKDATAQGEVLDKTPDSEVVVHTMYCNGGYCKPTQKTISIPAWPAK